MIAANDETAVQDCGDDNLANWQKRLAYRAAQLKEPGVWPMALVVDEDGGRFLVINGKLESLGKA